MKTIKNSKNNMKKVETEENYFSYNELLSIGKAINNMLLKSKEVKYSRKLMYALNKNLKIIQDELKMIEEGFEQVSEDLQDQVNEYTQKVREIAVDNGGIMRKSEEGREYVDIEHDDFDKESFDKLADEVEDEYEEVIDEVNRITEENNKAKEEEVSNADLYQFKLDMFPEELNLDDMPIVLIDLIEE